MNKRLLLFLFCFSFCTIFGQNTQTLRVLNLVPDDCYQLQLIEWPELATNFELTALDKDKILNPLYKEKKVIKDFVRSWVQQDSKCGIDFTATAAYINSNCLLVPLNDEKSFEKMVRKMGEKASFQSITHNGQTFRYLSDGSILCTDDIACIFVAKKFEDEIETPLGELQQTVLQNWDKMQRSTFPTSEIGKFFIQRGMISYVAYNAQHPDLKMLSGIINKQNSSLSSNLDKLNLLMFSTGSADKNQILGKTELYMSTPKGLEPISMTNLSSEGTRPLLPHLLENPIAVISCNVTGLGDSLAPFLSFRPEIQTLAPLLNHPFIGSLTSDKGYLLCTTLDNPKAVQPALEQYVALRNQALDSAFKALSVDTNDVIAVVNLRDQALDSASKARQVNDDEAVVEVVTDDDSGDDEEVVEEAPYRIPAEDSLVNHKQLTHTHADGYDLYILTTYKKDLDYETFTWLYKYDTVCYIMTKDNKLFLFGEAELMQNVLNPTKSMPTGIRTQDPLYARVDLNTLFREIEEEGIIPLRDIVIQTEDNIMTMEVNAIDGLTHNLMYELVKAAVEEFTKTRKEIKKFKF
ncbi:MAG: hypothetical protein IKQ75_09400 [Bacteroidales bacterium]|nr:hypothetical protein [Bacteroidales bacterium]